MTSNAPAERTALATASPLSVIDQLDAASLILGPGFDRVLAFADMMASGSVTVPEHLRGKKGDCVAVTLQALSRRFDPFAFAQKTHVTKNGILGYEGQLVSAMLSQHLEGEPEYEWFGDWDRILGRIEEKTGQGGGKYYVAAWKPEDEAGLGVICRATLRGESKPRELRVTMQQAYPRFSTQWATDPRQQICNLAVKKWGRLYKPAALLGVMDMEDAEAASQGERFMGMAEVVETRAAATPPAPTPPPTYPQADFDKNFPAWKGVIESGRRDAAHVIAMAEIKAPLTAEQRKQLDDLKARPAGQTTTGAPPAATPSPTPAPTPTPTGAPKPTPAPTPAPTQAPSAVSDVAPRFSYAQVADRITAAEKEQDREKLADAGLMIGGVPDPKQRAELVRLYNEANEAIL